MGTSANPTTLEAEGYEDIEVSGTLGSVILTQGTADSRRVDEVYVSMAVVPGLMMELAGAMGLRLELMTMFGEQGVSWSEGTSAAKLPCTCRRTPLTPEDPCGHGDTNEGCPVHDPDYYDDSRD